MLQAPSTNRAVVHAWADALSSGDVDAAAAQLSPDFVADYEWVPEPVRGPEGFKRMYAYIHSVFPDQKITIEREVNSGDRIGIQLSWTATHKGPYMGVPPTGKRIQIAGTCIFRMSDGKIAEAWVREDMLAIYQQLTQG